MPIRNGFTLIELLVVVAIVAILAALAMPNICCDYGSRSVVSRVRANHRSLATALESYFVDHKAFPPMVPLTFHEDYHARKMKGKGADQLGFPSRLTTPVAYLTSYLSDPFAPAEGLPSAYFTDGVGWIFISPGPDGEYDLRDPAHVYESAIPQPSVNLLAGPWTYDPSNGTLSSGDIWRVKQ